MNTKFLSLLAGAAILGSVSVATAAEPMPLTEVQLDSVTGGNPCAGNYSSNTCSATSTVSVWQKNKNETWQYAGNSSGDGSYNDNSGDNTNSNYTNQANFAYVESTATISGEE